MTGRCSEGVRVAVGVRWRRGEGGLTGSYGYEETGGGGCGGRAGGNGSRAGSDRGSGGGEVSMAVGRAGAKGETWLKPWQSCG